MSQQRDLPRSCSAKGQALAVEGLQIEEFTTMSRYVAVVRLSRGREVGDDWTLSSVSLQPLLFEECFRQASQLECVKYRPESMVRGKLQ